MIARAGALALALWPEEAATALRLGLTVVAAAILAMWLEFDTPSGAG